MSRLILAVLVVTSGCNQIFGIKDTNPIDAAPDTPPIPVKRVYLQWMIPKLLASGQPDPMLDYPAIGSEQLRPEMPKIQVGPEIGNGDLSEATYDVSDGSVRVPTELLGAPWRMTYQLPGAAFPTEVEWRVAGAHLTVPRLTRVDAPPVPPMSGYMVSPSPAPSLFAPVIITTGVFASGSSTFSGGTFTFDYADNGFPLAGPKGAPEQAKGDWLLATDWDTPNAQEMSVSGWAKANVSDLVANTLTMPSPPAWHTKGTLDRVDTLPISSNACSNRMISGALAGLANGTSCDEAMKYGLTPNSLMPGFTADGAPIILVLDTASANVNQLHLADTDSSVPLEHVLYSKVTNTRRVTTAQIQLESGLEVVAMANTQPVAVPYPAALSRSEALDPQDGATGPQDLSHMDNNMVKVGPNPVRLTFTFESAQDVGKDDLLITLYELTTGLTPVRAFQLPGDATFALIDSSLFVDGHTYVFSIRTHKGYPNAVDGDYRTVGYPFGQATKFSGTFKVTKM